MKKYNSVFAEHLENYVKLRRGLGLKFEGQDYLLRKFDQYLCERDYHGPLDQDLALAFACANSAVSRNEAARRYQVVRHFSDYLATFDPSTPRLNPHIMLRPRTRPAAYIYTEEELSLLLREARRISPKHPLRGITLHAIVGLGAACGLRIGEVAHLNKGDVDWQAGALTIRRTKFAKDRLVPLHPTTLAVLRDYAAVRDAAFPDNDSPAFFISMRGRGISKHTLQTSFWDLTRRVGLRGRTGPGPSFHDLRHTFAVRRLVSWYKEGADVQSLLPALATYMGHVHYSDTAYYLTATSELLELAAERHQRSLQREGQS